MPTAKQQSLAKWTVPHSALRRVCSEKELGFESTDQLKLSETFVGQDRALEAIQFGCEMKHDGFNLFVLGPPTTGKHSIVRAMLEKLAAKQSVPTDWVYVNNFEQPDKPIAIELPAGQALQLKADMDDLVEDLSATLPALFESDDYRARRRSIDDEVEQARERAFEELREQAKAKNVAILRTPMGFALAPTKNGEVMKPDVFNALPEIERKAFQESIERLQVLLENVLRQLPALEKQRHKDVIKLNAEVAELAVKTSIEQIAQKYAGLNKVSSYLKAAQVDLIENVGLFLTMDGAAAQDIVPQPHGASNREPRLKRYSVNVIVSNHRDELLAGAPLIEEHNPNLNNLTGRIEHVSQMGALLTDFTLIKPGALHKANGGYLMLDARRVLTEPFAWEALKRCLRSRQISITSLADHFSLTSTVSLQPDPIQLSVKVILIGDPMLYYLLSSLDPDFSELFKVEAEFEEHLDWSKKNIQLYAQMIGGIAKKEGLLSLSACGVAETISEAARATGDSQRLSLAMGELCDLLREANHWSVKAKQSQITAKSIQQAVAKRTHRRSLIQERSQEAVLRNIALIETSGKAVGQINGLSIIDLGRFRFGRPARITARVRAGVGKVVDIEREVELGGPLHSKGVLILSSFLASRYALNMPMSLWASLVFEQSYGGIDGDSASSAELYALLSALSGIPIQQQYAVTGSVNQNGEVQAIGGVNEKIEGFFDICRKRRLSGKQGVLIPKSNVQHLMLRPDVTDSVAAGRFNIFAVEHIDEGIEILTGTPAGKPSRKGMFPSGSINALVEKTLVSYAKMRMRHLGEDDANKAIGQ